MAGTDFLLYVLIGWENAGQPYKLLVVSKHGAPDIKPPVVVARFLK
jgi:hypothetical protein